MRWREGRLVKLWTTLRYSYWFVPSLMMLSAFVLAFGMEEIDRLQEGGLVEKLGWVYTGSSDGARELLSVVAGSMITVAGVVFSITIVALQLASSQFGPRVLRSFMRDRGNQVVLGTFIATFMYCLLVLRTIRGGAEALVPSLSVTVGVLLAAVSLAVLIFFIHHVAISIQATHIIRAIGHELYETIDLLFPEPIGEPQAPGSDAPPPERHDVVPVTAASTGYLQRVDDEALMRIAGEYDLVLHLPRRPGEFFVPGDVLVHASPAGNVDDSLAERIREAMPVGTSRTYEQDLIFAVDELVGVAARSLSPAVNDPITAAACVDWLAAGLVRRLGRRTPSALRYDEAGAPRVLAHPVELEEMVAASFDRIREYGRGHTMVMRTLLEALAHVGRHARTDEQRAILREQARLTRTAAAPLLDEDAARLDAAFTRTLAALR